jgi:hypothetical protein
LKKLLGEDNKTENIMINAENFLIHKLNAEILHYLRYIEEVIRQFRPNSRNEYLFLKVKNKIKQELVQMKKRSEDY